jgi:hypothetical protein
MFPIVPYFIPYSLPYVFTLATYITSPKEEIMIYLIWDSQRSIFILFYWGDGSDKDAHHKRKEIELSEVPVTN